jgi:hypothetical protein
VVGRFDFPPGLRNNESMTNRGDLVKSQLFSSLSFLRRQESSLFNGFWIPVFTGMTR